MKVRDYRVDRIGKIARAAKKAWTLCLQSPSTDRT